MHTPKMRPMKIDVTGFLRDYEDAVSSQMPVAEFCALLGITIGGLHSRCEQLAKRGIILPLLKGMRAKSRMGSRLLPKRVVDAVRVSHVEPTPVTLEAPKPQPPARIEAAPPVVSFQLCVGHDVVA